MVPLKYNIRSMRARWVTTFLTVVCIAFVVAVTCAVFGLVDGLQYSLKVSGEPLDLIILRQGSSNEINGGFESAKADELKTLPGIARDADGQPLASSELVTIPSMARADGSRANLIIRGIEVPERGAPPAQQLRPDFQIIAGTNLSGGKDECLISRALQGRFAGTNLGETLKINDKEQYQVVGIFTAGGSAAESEVWTDITKLAQNTYREGSVSTVQIRAASADALATLRKSIADDARFKLDAVLEPEYFAKQTTASTIIAVSGTIIALLLTLGALFAAANTMFAAVATRVREIGTMRALGFSRGQILVSFLTESVFLCALGGILGFLVVIPFNGYSFSTVNNFSETTFAFRTGPIVITVAFLMTLAMGVFGGLFPAIRAVRIEVISAIREL